MDALGRILVTDERRGSVVMTKFPGGGHHLGEGLGETLLREFMEETGMRVEIVDLFYVNDFLQISAFNPKDQLISIYYIVRPLEDLQVPQTEIVHDFDGLEGDCQTFRWVPLAAIDENDFTYPIDQKVVRKMRENMGYLESLLD
jgi:ADP-ribose pyrophosphatase YjhB (NUDIX family)